MSALSIPERVKVGDIARMCLRRLRPDLVALVGIEFDAFIKRVSDRKDWIAADDGTGLIHLKIGETSPNGECIYVILERRRFRRFQTAVPYLVSVRTREIQILYLYRYTIDKWVQWDSSSGLLRATHQAHTKTLLG